MLERADADRGARLDWLDALVAEGEADIAAGRFTALDRREDVHAPVSAALRESA